MLIHNHVYSGAFKKTSSSNRFFLQKQYMLITEKFKNVAKLKRKKHKTPLILLTSETPRSILK